MSSAHFVHDSNSILRDRLITPQRKHQAEVEEWIRAEEAHHIYCEDGEISPANSERQMGQTMTSSELEKRLLKILPPNIIFIDNPHNSTKKAIVKILPTGEQETICAYERGFMPEHSIMKVKVEEIRDMSQTRLERGDLPKHEITPSGVVWEEGATRPGFKKIKKLWGEQVRGWRTVLIRLVQSHLITPTQAESVFGSDNRPQWAVGVGKQQLQLPW